MFGSPWTSARLLSLVVLFLLATPAMALAQPAEEPGEEPAAAPPAAAAAEASGEETGTPAADADEPPPVTQEQKDEARVHFKKGLRLLQEEAWSPALAEFLASRELYPTRVATNNAAISLRKLQRYDEALDMFETFLRDFEVPPRERKEAQRQTNELRSLVGTIDIVGSEPGASIVVSSVDRGEYPPVKPIRVPAGNHVVRLFKEGYEPFETRIDVAGGSIASVEAKLVRLTDAGKLRVTERAGRTVTVVVDNVSVGQTPWEGQLSVGSHVVMLRGEGKIGTPPAAADIKSGELTSLTLLAEELESQLRVDPTPPGAAVSIDGVDVGNGVWLGRLKTGDHKVEVRSDGFLTVERSVTLQKGQRQTVAVELERDEDAPMWRKPSKWTVDVGASFLILPTLGGDVADACDADCSASPGIGVAGMVRGAYELGSGLGFGIEVGYLLASHEVTDHTSALTPNGLSSANEGRATDRMRLQAFMAGANIGYHVGEEYPFAVRLGAGIMLGELRDERDGAFVARAGDSYRTSPVATFPGMTYIYIDPEIRAGVRFLEHFELTGSVQALMMVGITQPKFDPSLQVAAGSDGLGSYGEDTLMGSFVVAIAPGANLRYDF